MTTVYVHIYVYVYLLKVIGQFEVSMKTVSLIVPADHTRSENGDQRDG